MRKLKLEKNTQDILAENSYLDYYNNTFEKWFKGVAILSQIVDGNRTITAYQGDEVLANVIAWLEEKI